MSAANDKDVLLFEYKAQSYLLHWPNLKHEQLDGSKNVNDNMVNWSKNYTAHNIVSAVIVWWLFQ